MEKEYLLKQIAEAGYNVGFGAKKHFATYDIVEKAPGLIAFSSMAVGIFGLVIDILSAKLLSAGFLVLGVAGLYIERYNADKNNYAEKGTEITRLFNDIKSLYYKAKSYDEKNLEKYEKELNIILDRYYKISISKHILFSDWYTHYKFFWQHQIEWIEEQKKFKFWRDKIPLSLLLTLIFLVLSLSLIRIFYDP